MRLIDVDELIEAHYKACEEDQEKTFETWSLRLMWDAKTIDNAKHGKWIVEPYNDKLVTLRCGECFRCYCITSKDVKKCADYCPHCGAKMDGGFI